MLPDPNQLPATVTQKRPWGRIERSAGKADSRHVELIGHDGEILATVAVWPHAALSERVRVSWFGGGSVERAVALQSALWEALAIVKAEMEALEK